MLSLCHWGLLKAQRGYVACPGSHSPQGWASSQPCSPALLLLPTGGIRLCGQRAQSAPGQELIFLKQEGSMGASG